MSNVTSNRQLYPDVLRGASLIKIVVFHFVGWQLLTYLPSLGIMFALGGWFIAISLNNKPIPSVIFDRLVRLLPTWWTFAILALFGGFLYAAGAKVSLDPSIAWLFPFQRPTWNLDTSYANDVTVVTWYIAAYLWLMFLSPLLHRVYTKLSWFAVYACVLGTVIYCQLFPEQDTIFGQTMFDVLTFSGCWMLGFTKADGAINKLPRYIVWSTAIVCSACAIFLTYDTQTLSSNPTALSLMSFGIAMLLLSFNPDFSNLSTYTKSMISIINTYAVTIYLFHNSLIDVAYELGKRIDVYQIGNLVGVQQYPGEIGNFACFVILLGLLYAAIKTIGIVETHVWVRQPTTCANRIKISEPNHGSTK